MRSRVLLNLDYDDCRAYFERLERQEEKHRALFSEHNYMEVYYEDLARNAEKTIKDIGSFLEVPYKIPYCPLKKQIEAPMNEVISNFEQLKEAFSNQRWAQFFLPAAVISGSSEGSI
jgi:hypothetical protein